VDRYYAPLARWLASRVERATKRPFVLGIQGPQGCGKTTLASALVTAFEDVGVRSVSVSIDDFYLTHAEQRALAAAHPGNRALEHRGYPGTHDVALGSRVLAELRAVGQGGMVRIPSYDKSAHAGRGDRAPESRWRQVAGPVDLVVVEGWMLGFSPLSEQALGAVAASADAALSVVNEFLRPYGAWTRALDALVHLDVATLDTIVTWRVDAERARRERREPALSDDDARDYIERFLPAYRAYVPQLRVHPPCDDFECVTLAADRQPVESWRAPQ